MVSSHFSYTEEYVMEHTFPWLNRKFQQALKEQWERSSAHVIEGYKSLMLLMDSAFNKGKDFDKLMPSSYEVALKQHTEGQQENSKFISGQWWNSTTKNEGETSE